MARDYVTDIRNLITTAEANGWQRCPGKSNTLRRITRHDTPKTIPSRWWARPTYEAVEFLSFVVADRNRAPKVIHGVGRAPWVGRQDAKISYKRATELLAQPVGESPVHTNH